MTFDLTESWKKYPIVAFDTETSGAYPVRDEIVELAAVRIEPNGQRHVWTHLFKPHKPMNEEIIKIHGITNEMVQDQPYFQDKVHEVRDFIQDSILVAHHAPFDLGFLTLEFERAKLDFPKNVLLCSSLLSRELFKNSVNHKLQTLIKYFQLPQGQAHRAEDDAEACMQVTLKCLEKLPSQTLQEALKVQRKPLAWENYTLLRSSTDKFRKVFEATEKGLGLDILYEGGSLKGKTRRIFPFGIIRNPDGDYVQAICAIDKAAKRFYINKMAEVEIVFATLPR